MRTKRSQILEILICRGSITKAYAAKKHLSYGLGDHIYDLRKNHKIDTVMIKECGHHEYAKYVYRGKI